MRLFLSIDPPRTVREAIHSCCPALKQIKLEPAEQLHLTLLFLGEQPPTTVDLIEQASQYLTTAPFELRLAGVGQFRSGIIWLGVQPQPALMKLQQKLSQRLTNDGIDLETRVYHPHLTLARSRKPLRNQQLRAFLDTFQDRSFSFQANSILLKQSQLYSTGARHECLAEWHFS
ncbi:RNA 2',3'-cyclic phosphodiesterase [Amphritea balenae]|uniref:RNA 2',3'-cyclic phosphodiesterase n=1 Tax=Amphritea balenae TaxID=452629 RepID=A0A3P1SKR4_9GAMM|nr:RNA 2',3'-cyclic phosphodiesterase [Amphritea balenae]RRC97738.1 RNA 2',3'-cyclic phosphodiesterase [Amphritea balenae]GGK82654.1 RNA 2',3'-cyclic phosphodiesterase [Amphritea balenae]